MAKPSRPRSKAHRPAGLGKPTPPPPPAKPRPTISGGAEAPAPANPAPAATQAQPVSPTRRRRALGTLRTALRHLGRAGAWVAGTWPGRIVGLAVIAGIVCAVVFWPSSSPSGPLPDGVAARVGPTLITTADLDRAVAQAQAAGSFGQDPSTPASTAAQPSPGSAEYREAVRTVMAGLVQRAVIHREAIRCGKPCAVSAAQIAKARSKVVKEEFGGSAAAFDSFLKERTLEEADVTAILRQEAEQRKLIAHYGGAPKVSRAQAQAYYDGHREEFAIPEATHVSHILVASRVEAERLRKGLTPAGFAEAAREHSLDTATAKRGGLLPDLGVGMSTGISADFDKALASLKPGEISQPVRSSFGWHLLRASSTPRRIPPFSEIASKVRTSRRQSIISGRLDKWEAAVKKRWDAKTVYSSPSLAPLPPEPVAPQQPTAPDPAPQVPTVPDPTPQVPTVPDPTPKVPGP